MSTTTDIPFPARPAQPAAVANSEIVRTAGAHYEDTQNLDIVQVADLVRSDLRAAKKKGAGILSDAKISVRTSRYSMGQSIIVRITLPRVTRHPVDMDRPDLDWVSTPEETAVHAAVAEIAGAYNRDETDVLTDYFRSRFHLSITVTGPSPL